MIFTAAHSVEMHVKITKKRLRQIIREEVGRNFHTTNQDPNSWFDQKGYDVLIYMDTSDQHWHVIIEKEDDDGVKKEVISKKFRDGEEAKHWARMQSDKIRGKYFASDGKDLSWESFDIT